MCSRDIMDITMCRPRNYSQVFNSIIHFVSVFVVNNFCGFQFSFKMFTQYCSASMHKFVFVLYENISICIKKSISYIFRLFNKFINVWISMAKESPIVHTTKTMCAPLVGAVIFIAFRNYASLIHGVIIYYD